MNPGRDLDILIADKVLRLKKLNEGFEGSNFEPVFAYDNISGYRADDYSTNIQAAMDVVEEIKNMHPYIICWGGVHPGVFAMEWDETKWRVGWKIDIEYEGDCFQVCAVAETLPHAICLAALKVVEYEK